MTSSLSSGLHLRISPIQTLVFLNVKNSSTMVIVLAQHIEAHTFTECDLVVRSHAGTNLTGGGGIVIDLLSDGTDFEDPATSFLGSSVLTTPITLGAAGTYQIATSTKPFGRHLAVQLTATQSAGGGTLTGSFSVDLTLKGGDPSSLMSGPNSFQGYKIM